MADELTVEKALKELREMFPNRPISVQEKAGVSFKVPDSDTARRFKYYRIFVAPRNWRKPTLSEAMAQVRKWKESQL